GEYQEHLVLDTNSTLLKMRYFELIGKTQVPQEGSKFSEEYNLSILKQLEHFTYNLFIAENAEEAVAKLMAPLLVEAAEGKVSATGTTKKNIFILLDKFIKNRAGVCRHRALLNAFFLSKFI